MNRGDVWWVDFPLPVGRRPAVLVLRGEAYRYRTSIAVVPLTRTIRDIPVEVPLGPQDGIPRRSVANADDITSVAKKRIRRYVTTLSETKLKALDEAIKFALDLP